jgi:hypothetical protein
MAIARYNLIAKTLRQSFELLPLALLAAKGTRVEVGPFDDEVLARTYVWIRGDEQEVKDTLQRLDHAVQDHGITYLKTPVRLGRAKE